MISTKARRATGRKSSPHPEPSACMPFIISNAAGKDLIVTPCGIGGAPFGESWQTHPSTPLTPDTSLCKSPPSIRTLTPGRRRAKLKNISSAFIEGKYYAARNELLVRSSTSR
jgi:hypothetical protein